ncbi:class I SAM-dependent methyltransferase [Sporosarcina sp. HYO08]|uniref:class I SAM-dependent methyltransferase n=1 Tax=Sporosarcina sp. HYO08 TaxID=1759557 RepID=UPI000797B699|nr:class I SAM-dependent methyltransferase [Sporosarcina sp. HYO08]KXH80625.1 SAM-dependent methyltransferase [Sporosarcina sp. HYO08]
MGERKFDRMLQIRTVGLREWRQQTDNYNRYEATPYAALEKLFRSYTVKPTDRVVDFGSGRGRVSFYIHHHFNVPVTGVEMNDKTYEEALYNKAVYRQKNKHLHAPIRFEFGLAEQYQVEPEDNTFYFFNPFSVTIFKQVVRNILRSVEQEKRTVDMILYYPLPEFKKFLKKETPFKLINKIKAHSDHGKYGKFLIYRLA